MTNIVTIVLALLFLLCSANSSRANDVPPLYTVSLQEVEMAIGKALEEKGVAEHVKAYIIGLKQEAAYSGNHPLTVEVRGVQTEEMGSRFSANVLFKHGADILAAKPYTGRYQEMIELPVLTRGFAAGQAITQDDIEYKLFPKGRSRIDVITKAADLIGQTPRRQVSEGRPIRTIEVGAPSVVKRNAVVQVIYKTGAMEISTTAQAMEAGSKGDVIPVRNMNSRQIVRAMVVDEHNVSIMPFTQSSELKGNAYAAN